MQQSQEYNSLTISNLFISKKGRHQNAQRVGQVAAVSVANWIIIIIHPINFLIPCHYLRTIVPFFLIFFILLLSFQVTVNITAATSYQAFSHSFVVIWVTFRGVNMRSSTLKWYFFTSLSLSTLPLIFAFGIVLEMYVLIGLHANSLELED